MSSTKSAKCDIIFTVVLFIKKREKYLKTDKFLPLLLVKLIIVSVFLPIFEAYSIDTDGNSTALSYEQAGDEKSKQDIKSAEADALQASSMALFAAALVAPTYLMNCSNKPSVWIYSGTAVMYLGMEVLNWGKYEDASTHKMIIYDNKDKDKQVAALDAAEKVTKEAANGAQKKAKWAKYASVGFGIAAAVSLVEAFADWEMLGGACSGAASSRIQPNKNQLNYMSFICANSYAGLKDNSVEKFGIGAGLAGAGLMYMLKDYVGKYLFKKDAVMSNGLIRAALFGATALLASNTHKKLQVVADKLNDRADKYRSLKIQLMNANASGLIGRQAQVITQQMITTTTNGASIQTTSPMCFSGDATTLKPQNCDECKAGNCKTSSIPNVNFPTFDTPPFLTNSIGHLSQTADSLYSGNLQGAITNGDSMIQGAAKINKLKKSLEGKINKRLKNEQKPQFDFKKSRNFFKSKLLDATNKALTDMSPKDRNKLLQLSGNGQMHTASTTTGTSKKGKGDLESSTEDIFEPEQSDGPGGPDLSFLEEKQKVEVSADKTIDGEAVYDYNHADDISKRPETSIFQILTVRYLKTAFPRLFNLKDEKPPTVENKVK
ncbi:MAG: hypothetical protein ISR65_11720 [Bacteriovoracaceae bacterium]|nr:hypothetical protein [Bacteriovoracaceae bacterium]